MSVLSEVSDVLLSKQAVLGLEVSLQNSSLVVYYIKEGLTLRIAVNEKTGAIRFSVDDDIASYSSLRTMEKLVNDSSISLIEAILYLRYKVNINSRNFSLENWY